MRKVFAYCLLLASLLLLGAEYALLLATEQRRSSATLRLAAQDDGWMAGCMLSAITENHLKLLAEAVARPATPALFEAVMTEALQGAATAEKSEALRALHDRDQARARAVNAINGVADACGYWGAPRRIAPFEFTVARLGQHSRFQELLMKVRERSPDRADEFYRKHKARHSAVNHRGSRLADRGHETIGPNARAARTPYGIPVGA